MNLAVLGSKNKMVIFKLSKWIAICALVSTAIVVLACGESTTSDDDYVPPAVTTNISTVVEIQQPTPTSIIKPPVEAMVVAPKYNAPEKKDDSSGNTTDTETPVIGDVGLTEKPAVNKKEKKTEKVQKIEIVYHKDRTFDRGQHAFASSGITDNDWMIGMKQTALINPDFVTAKKASQYYKNTDLVIGIDHNGVQKAYSTQYMELYEIINDEFGTDPVLVTY
ncbi:MAG TPA: hypothetical protein DEZ08_00145 [Dehalococcoidia bacterium]|nr:hypothetical protein [Dehalococcoidia bacterium]